MDYDDLTDDEVTRLSILGQLECLAFEERQTDHEPNVPIANIPSELQCMWFDDFYHPEATYFQAVFGPAELTALVEFSAFFRANEPVLPRDPESIQIWLDDPAWRKIMGKAADTLRLLNDPRPKAG